uniref:Pheophorbide a oxygenase domain-containing protein n=1 Tax=Chrysotila carterae TaxID=13221 RepID=A0A7S4C4M9_CHRCT
MCSTRRTCPSRTTRPSRIVGRRDLSPSDSEDRSAARDSRRIVAARLKKPKLLKRLTRPKRPKRRDRRARLAQSASSRRCWCSPRRTGPTPSPTTTSFTRCPRDLDDAASSCASASRKAEHTRDSLRQYELEPSRDPLIGCARCFMRCSTFARSVRPHSKVSAMRPPLKWIIGLSFTRLPKWLLHLSNHAVLEDDNIFLHAQGHAYRGSVKEREGAQLVPEWRQRLHMPATADSIVIAFRRWLDDYTAGRGVAWSPMLPADLETSANVRASKETLLERGDSHVQHCSCCQGALAFARRGRTASDVLLPLALLLTALSGNRVAARAGLVAAAAAGVASHACTAMQHKLLVGDYPPPRNARK